MWKSVVIIIVFPIFLMNILGYEDSGSDTSTPIEKIEDGNCGRGKILGCFSRKRKTPKFVMKSTNEIIESDNYIPEIYDVNVRVGRNLTVKKSWSLLKKKTKEYWNTFKIRIFRIRDKKRLDEKNLPVVLLMHGCTGSSSDYVFGGPGNSLGYYLVDRGYDVWLGNFRGNYYGGLNIKNKTKYFWDFSFHEMGIYDLPDQIDFILNKTDQKKIIYAGFSMGNTAAFVMLSKLPEYNEKIERMISIAPVVMFDFSIANFIEKVILASHYLYDKLMQFTHIRTFSYWNAPLYGFRKPKCYKPGWKGVCKRTIGILASKHETVYNEELRKKFTLIAPVGASMKTVTHYLKIAESGEFKPYSYYASKNKKEYNVYYTQPYPLENVNVKTLLLIGPNDYLTHGTLIDKLKNKLKKMEERIVEKWVDNKNFNHLDFFIGQNLEKLVFEPILEFLNNEEIK